MSSGKVRHTGFPRPLTHCTQSPNSAPPKSFFLMSHLLQAVCPFLPEVRDHPDSPGEAHQLRVLRKRPSVCLSVVKAATWLLSHLMGQHELSLGRDPGSHICLVLSTCVEITDGHGSESPGAGHTKMIKTSEIKPGLGYKGNSLPPN